MKPQVKCFLLIAALLASLLLLGYITKRPRRVWLPVYGGMTSELKDSEFYEDMSSGKTFCFLGDSITCGTETGGITWFDPLVPYIKGDVINYSYGGWTSKDLAGNLEPIPAADIYVVAVGINDVLRAEELPDEFTTEKYIANLEVLTDRLRESSPDSKIYFITPWIFFDRSDECNRLREEFSEALMNWCNGEDRICIDPYPFTLAVTEADGREPYMYNYFHPNAERGVGLFSYSVLAADHQRRLNLE